MDRLQTRTDPVSAAERFEYDGLGNLTRQTDRKGQVATFSYDGLNRRSGATYADSTTSFSYDAGGRLIQAVDSAGGAILTQFDVLDRLLALQTALGTVAYQYDAAGRRTLMTAPGQALTSYTYDAASRLTQIAQGGQVAGVQYDAAGRRSRLTLPNQVSTDYQYDAGSRLAALIYRNATGQLGDLTYQYDPAGNRTGIGGSFARTGFPNPVASASYSAANQQVSFGSQLLTYDANGNLTSDGVNLYTWNARNQLLAITGPGMTASFSYDALGRRQSRSVNGASTQFLYDGLTPIQEAGSTGIATLLTGLGIDEYLTRTDAAGARTLVTDALGSAVALTDASGIVQTQYTYEPFGATAVTGSANANAFQYTGRENDGTGLYYYRARYYHPGFARFIAEDPWRLRPDTTNVFTYASDSPLTFSDPLGLKAWALGVYFSGPTFGSGNFAAGIVVDDNGQVGTYISGGGGSSLSLSPTNISGLVQFQSSTATTIQGLAGWSGTFDTTVGAPIPIVTPFGAIPLPVAMQATAAIGTTSPTGPLQGPVTGGIGIGLGTPGVSVNSGISITRVRCLINCRADQAGSAAALSGEAPTTLSGRKPMP